MPFKEHSELQSNFSENNALHSLGVAKLCELFAKKLHWSLESQRAAFLMGWIHDTGKHWTTEDHAEFIFKAINESYQVKSNNGLSSAWAIRHHGLLVDEFFNYSGSLPRSEKESWLVVLNAADMQTASNGIVVSYEDRLKDIAYKYSVESETYKNAVKIVEKLKEFEELVAPIN